MPTNPVLFFTRFDVSDEEKQEIPFVKSSVVGRSCLSPGNLKLSRKIAVVEQNIDEANQCIWTLTCMSKRPIFQQKLSHITNSENPTSNKHLELPFSNAYRTECDKCTLELKNGDLLSFLPKSFIYTVNVRDTDLEQLQNVLRDQSTNVENEDTDYDDLSEERQQHESELKVSEPCFEVIGSKAAATTLKHNRPKSIHVNTSTEKVSARRRILPAWMSEDVEVLNKSIDKKYRGRTGSRQPKQAARTQPILEREEMNVSDSDVVQDDDDEEEEEEEVILPKRSVKPSRQRRAAAARIGSYAENDFVASDSDFSHSDEEYSTTKSSKRRKKYESDEEYEEEENVVNDSASDLDTWSGSQRRRSSSGRQHRKTTTGRSRPSSSKKHKTPRKSSRRKRSIDDEFIDDEEEEEMNIKPKTSKHPAVNRVACQYGGNCYRKNPAHKKDFSHPGDNDWPENGDDQDDDEDGGSSSSPINIKTKVLAKRKFQLADDSASREQSFASGASDDSDYGSTKRKFVSTKKGGKRRKH